MPTAATHASVHSSSGPFFLSICLQNAVPLVLMHLATQRKNRNSRCGFTLIEIMIVISIIAAVMAVGAPRMFSSTSQMRSQVRKIAILPREVRNVARLFNMTGRLSITMDDEKGHTYSVDSASGNVTFLSKEREEELGRLTRAQREDEGEKDPFQPETRVLKRPVRLPRGLFFGGVEFGSKEKEITSGTAYVHFFPQGLAEEVAIHLTDRKTLNWTITIHPLTGRAEIYERKVTLKELKQ